MTCMGDDDANNNNFRRAVGVEISLPPLKMPLTYTRGCCYRTSRENIEDDDDDAVILGLGLSSQSINLDA